MGVVLCILYLVVTSGRASSRRGTYLWSWNATPQPAAGSREKPAGGKFTPPARNPAAGGGPRGELCPLARPLLGAAEAPPPAARSRRRRVPGPRPAPSRPRALAPSHRGRARCACRAGSGASRVPENVRRGGGYGA